MVDIIFRKLRAAWNIQNTGAIIRSSLNLIRNLSAFIGESSLSIVEAMEKIDVNVRGILFVIDEEKKLIGSITDGDIRRWLISTGPSYSIPKLHNFGNAL